MSCNGKRLQIDLFRGTTVHYSRLTACLNLTTV